LPGLTIEDQYFFGKTEGQAYQAEPSRPENPRSHRGRNQHNYHLWRAS